MKGKDLKQLAKRLDLSVSVLKGIQKGEKRGAGQLMANNMAKCLGNIAKRTGYKDKASAERAIERDIRLLYVASEDFGARVQRFANNTHNKKNKELLNTAAGLLLSGNVKGFSKLIAKHPQLSFLKRTCTTKVDNALIDTLRQQKKQNRKTAQALLSAIGAGGEKILIKGSAIKSAVRKRVKRYGTIPSLFWEAAVEFNPKVRVKGVSAAKKKPKQKTRGAASKTFRNSQGYIASIDHHIEGESASYRGKLNKITKQNEQYWAKMAEKEILAYMSLDKYLGK